MSSVGQVVREIVMSRYEGLGAFALGARHFLWFDMLFILFHTLGSVSQ